MNNWRHDNFFFDDVRVSLYFIHDVLNFNAHFRQNITINHVLNIF